MVRDGGNAGGEEEREGALEKGGGSLSREPLGHDVEMGGGGFEAASEVHTAGRNSVTSHVIF